MAKICSAEHKKTNPNKLNLFVLSAVYCVLRISQLDDTYAMSQCKVAVNAT
jgi:hypothetical protein